ncbi:MAG: hypothetical protein F4051_17285 [Boseongicola sp. SB0670_bin_30]|nr:hypothetical protein [Boseongicola sp. SB0670_bin_30]
MQGTAAWATVLQNGLVRTPWKPVSDRRSSERRFIATIMRRLDSLEAITRGQRDSQTATGGDRALLRECDSLESLYAKAALRQFCMALLRGAIDGWSLADFEEATGFKFVHEGTLNEDLSPMSGFLNRLLALPIDEQYQLFTALESRIDFNIEQAFDAEQVRSERTSFGLDGEFAMTGTSWAPAASRSRDPSTATPMR